MNEDTVILEGDEPVDIPAREDSDVLTIWTNDFFAEFDHEALHENLGGGITVGWSVEGTLLDIAWLDHGDPDSPMVHIMDVDIASIHDGTVTPEYAADVVKNTLVHAIEEAQRG